MSNPLTLGGLAAKLTNYIPGIDVGTAHRLINQAYVNEAQAHSWAFLIKRWTLQTEASYNVGTLQVTNGQNAVVLSSDGTWSTGWTTTPSMRRVAIQGRMEPYDIMITGANTGTLGDPWIGDTLPAATYTMWRDTYPVPADHGYAKSIALYDPLLRATHGSGRLPMRTQGIFLRDRAAQPWLVNFPIEFAMMNQTTEAPPRPQFQMWPAPATVRAYHGWYFRRPDFMTADAQYPDWPAEFQDMIWLSATIAWYETPRHNSPQKYLPQFKVRYADLYKRMVKDLDGDAAIDNQIEDAFTGSPRGGSNANWNGGNIFANVGARMTGS